jgi:DNA-binding HxlR family transcriptional regulator
MRSYGQYCALARALDIVGERWTLLIVRELMIRPSRYTDLRDGLPGIASNLLADRLAALEAHGVVTRTQDPAPGSPVRYALTERGRELEAALDALTRWGGPLMFEPPGEDAFRGRWLAGALTANGVTPPAGVANAELAIDTGAEQFTLAVRDGAFIIEDTPATAPDATLRGDPQAVMGLLLGFLDLETARALGATVEGESAILAAAAQSRSAAGSADG